MPADIRIPGDDHREEITRCLSRSMNFPLERALRRAPRLPIEDFRCAFDDGHVVATAAEHHFLQWFGGRPVKMSGIWGVATLPEHRESGLASGAVRRLLEEARGRGVPISALFPAAMRPYRRLGYELAGTYVRHRLPLESVPPPSDDDLPVVEIADIERDLDGVRACYHEWVRHRHAALEPTDGRWWTERIFDDGGEESFGAVIVREGDAVTGFATFTREGDPGRLHLEFGLDCSSFIALDARALRALLTYFRGFRGLGRWIEWAGPPQEPIALELDEQELAQGFRFEWMLRVLDVPGALTARGWPGIDADVLFAIDDPMFPENAGPWRLSVRDGEAAVDAVSPTEAARPPRPISIGAFSSMFTGFLRVADAIRFGILDRDDPATSALAQLLLGPDPWSPFFF